MSDTPRNSLSKEIIEQISKYSADANKFFLLSTDYHKSFHNFLITLSSGAIVLSVNLIDKPGDIVWLRWAWGILCLTILLSLFRTIFTANDYKIKSRRSSWAVGYYKHLNKDDPTVADVIYNKKVIKLDNKIKRNETIAMILTSCSAITFLMSIILLVVFANTIKIQ